MVCVDADINPWLARSPEGESVGIPWIADSAELYAAFGTDFADGVTKALLPQLSGWRFELVAWEKMELQMCAC